MHFALGKLMSVLKHNIIFLLACSDLTVIWNY